MNTFRAQYIVLWAWRWKCAGHKQESGKRQLLFLSSQVLKLVQHGNEGCRNAFLMNHIPHFPTGLLVLHWINPLSCNSGPRHQHYLRGGSCSHNSSADLLIEHRKISQGRCLLLWYRGTISRRSVNPSLVFIFFFFLVWCLHPGHFWWVRNILQIGHLIWESPCKESFISVLISGLCCSVSCPGTMLAKHFSESGLWGAVVLEKEELISSSEYVLESQNCVISPLAYNCYLSLSFFYCLFLFFPPLLESSQKMCLVD